MVTWLDVEISSSKSYKALWDKPSTKQGSVSVAARATWAGETGACIRTSFSPAQVCADSQSDLQFRSFVAMTVSLVSVLTFPPSPDRLCLTSSF